MKTRLGFVSNSSSSSFILGVKGKLTKELLLDEFQMIKESPLYPLALSLASFIEKDAELYELEDDYEPNWYKERNPEFTYYVFGGSSEEYDPISQLLYCCSEKDLFNNTDSMFLKRVY